MKFEILTHYVKLNSFIALSYCNNIIILQCLKNRILDKDLETDPFSTNNFYADKHPDRVMKHTVYTYRVKKFSIVGFFTHFHMHDNILLVSNCLF